MDKGKEPSEVVGWTEISEERDFATSDFEGLIFNQPSLSKVTKRSKGRSGAGTTQLISVIDKAGSGGKEHNVTRGSAGTLESGRQYMVASSPSLNVELIDGTKDSALSSH